jgi:hypothetical protein
VQAASKMMEKPISLALSRGQRSNSFMGQPLGESMKAAESRLGSA